MVTLCKLVFAITGLLTASILLSFAEESCQEYGCYKKSLFNCRSCKKECKWRHVVKKYEGAGKP